MVRTAETETEVDSGKRTKYAERGELFPWHKKQNKTDNVRINVILRRVRVTIVAVVKQLWVCVCSFSHPICRAHASYCSVICDL